MGIAKTPKINRKILTALEKEFSGQHWIAFKPTSLKDGGWESADGRRIVQFCINFTRTELRSRLAKATKALTLK